MLERLSRLSKDTDVGRQIVEAILAGGLWRLRSRERRGARHIVDAARALVGNRLGLIAIKHKLVKDRFGLVQEVQALDEDAYLGPGSIRRPADTRPPEGMLTVCGQSIREETSHWIRGMLAPFAGAFPLNDAESRSISPIMIVGCGRSGNTLLRSMLVQGGEIAIPPESYVWPSIARGYAKWRYSSWQTVTDQVVDLIHKIGICLVGSRSLFDEDGCA